MSATQPSGYVFFDTETGGLDYRINPLLSAAAVFADLIFREKDGFAYKIIPPEDTHLEFPDPQQHFPPEEFRYRPRRIIGYYHIASRTMREPVGGQPPVPGCHIVSAGAAEVNHFVTPDAEGHWNLEACHDWVKSGMTLELASTNMLQWINAYFADQTILAITHNADFDHRFMKAYLPTVEQRFWRRQAGTASTYGYRLAAAAKKASKGKSDEDDTHDWFCTMRSFQSYVKSRDPSARRGWKLSDLAAAAKFSNDKPHEALADCRTGLAGLRWLLAEGFGPRFALPGAA